MEVIRDLNESDFNEIRWAEARLQKVEEQVEAMNIIYTCIFHDPERGDIFLEQNQLLQVIVPDMSNTIFSQKLSYTYITPSITAAIDWTMMDICPPHGKLIHRLPSKQHMALYVITR